MAARKRAPIIVPGAPGQRAAVEFVQVASIACEDDETVRHVGALHVIDTIQYPDGKYRPEEKDRGKISPEAYRKIHADILRQDQWIIE